LKYAKTGTPYWLVKVNLPGGQAYQKKHSCEKEAERDRVRLLREYGGGSITAGDLRLHEMAQHKLDTCQADARGHSILEAVEFFIEHYRDPAKAPRVELCIGAFFREHVRKLRPHSQLEYKRTLVPFLLHEVTSTDKAFWETVAPFHTDGASSDAAYCKSHRSLRKLRLQFNAYSSD
jgi:hypothetical protein